MLDKKLSDMGPTALNLLQSTLDVDPENRISAEECMGHPYFLGFREKF